MGIFQKYNQLTFRLIDENNFLLYMHVGAVGRIIRQAAGLM